MSGDDVRALTVRQPWAWAIAHGGKTIENRSKGTRYRGALLIHAGAGWSSRGATSRLVRGAWHAAGLPTVTALNEQLGEWVSGAATVHSDAIAVKAVVAIAQLVDSHPDAGCCRPWGESSYIEGDGRVRTAVHHLLLEDILPLAEPVPCRGALGLWRPPADVVAAAWDGDVDMASLRPRTS